MVTGRYSICERNVPAVAQVVEQVPSTNWRFGGLVPVCMPSILGQNTNPMLLSYESIRV